MLLNDLSGKAVVITGGTKGIGLAMGLAFGAEGAQVYLTHRWGSADETELKQRFEAVGAPAPRILEADASNKEDTEALFAEIKKHHESIEVFVSNVSFAQVNKKGLAGYKKRAFFRSLEYSAWPMMGYLQQIKEVFGCYPRYSLGSSCDGPDTYYPGYDYVAISKAVMETFCRYMSKHLWEEQQATINIIRSRPISTESLEATFGPEYEPFLRKYYGDDYFVDLEQFGQAALALCSGLMDAVTGQILLLDKGVGFQDNLMRL
ncbi:MAG: SDR family oxidoreductase, partial [Deltaproteobacteria bacterium]|nr:SDR family oxidoreductase [Deltaproteobacteria bacterium]